jgi:hypothetical protein
MGLVLGILGIIYCVGLLAAFAYGSGIFKTKKNFVDFEELLAIFFISFFSWIGLLALIVGMNIKHGHDNK